MKLLYTDISQDMTQILTKEAENYAAKGKRVFYIAPNSLSFEKERKVLEYLPQQASFQITVTRFAQMARYFVLNSVQAKQGIDDVGLSMVFFRVLSQLDESDLRVYGRLRKDPAFIQQLVDLYKEVKTANVSLFDLQLLDDEKGDDLLKIFLAVSDLLDQHQMENESKLTFFAEQVQNGSLDLALDNTVLVVDGFTRFSAEEEYLIHLLSDKCQEIVIGTYASQKAYRANFIQGNIYQASVEFLRGLATTYAAKPFYIESSNEKTSDFFKLTTFWEGQHDFKPLDGKWQAESAHSIQIWHHGQQKEEIEDVAKKIRQLLADGVRYKDILVLLGDVESYKLQVQQLFEKFDIPYYFGKAESMSAHPLVHFVDSLERMKRYNYRAEDVLDLLKSGLYGTFSEEESDRFAHYVTYADIKGRSRFTKDFTVDNGGKYDLEYLNRIRQDLVGPLDRFLQARAQKGENLLSKFQAFLSEIQLPENMERLAATGTDHDVDKDEQVWKVFTDLLVQMATIFGQDQLTVDDFLSLLRSGMLAADYRTVPATVDVVSVKSYDLVEPHSKPYVFALGMTRSHFPKIAQNKSLLTDEDRTWLNEQTGDFSNLEIVSGENIKKNHFAALSLLNAATKQLTLSYPSLLNEAEDELSVYLKEWIELGVPAENRHRRKLEADADGIGHYKDLLSTVLALQQGELERELTKEEQTFWSVAVRYLRKRLKENKVLIPQVVDDVTTQKVSDQVMAIRFPKEEPIRLSASGLATFYNNQYLYFLRYVLGLKELESIHPDSRHHGMYLHRIFEKTMKEDSREFDARLEEAIQETSQESQYSFLYGQDEEGRLSQAMLDDIARSTATVLRQHQAIEIASQEEQFKLRLQNAVQIGGIIDRVDRLSDGSLGVVDYKSGANQFDIQKFYNGLNSQLVTYLEALRSQYGVGEEQLFGAMYLHMQNPTVDLKQAKSYEDLGQKANKELVYKGLFAEAEKPLLTKGAYHLHNATYQTEELTTLLDYNAHLYLTAADRIRKGEFLINPYTTDGKSVQGEQLKNITHFEADRHMKHARKLLKLPTKGKKEAFLALMQEEIAKEDNRGEEL